MPLPHVQRARRRRRARAAVLGTALTASVLPLLPGTSVAASTATDSAAVSAAAPARPVTGTYRDARLPVADRVEDLLERMTLEEKVGQMTQAERGSLPATSTALITDLKLGSLLSGGGSTPTPNTPTAWADMVDTYQAAALRTRLGIPLIYGVDAVHGHGNVVGATIFPHNVGLGATRNPALAETIGHVTAEEVRATGIPWNFAPCVCVSRDERWGRSYEAFSEEPALVIQMETVIDGLQGRKPNQLDDNDRVLATAKHFAGDGDTEYGTAAGDYEIDQGVTVTSRADFERIDLAPFIPAIKQHRAGSVMPSFSSVDFTEDAAGPFKMHGSRELITGWLKEKHGFDGFVISDWEGIHQLPGDYAAQVRAGVNAGIDMMMEPNTAPRFITTLLAEVRAGRVSQERIDDAVSRILRKKFELGLFEKPYADRTHLHEVGSEAHRAVARQAVAESQVLLKNSGRALPLRPDARIYVAGRNADDIGNQSGGWTRTWQGGSGDIMPGDTILEGIREVAPNAQITYSKDAATPTAGMDVGVVVVGETPYAEGFGDVGGPRWGYDPDDRGVQREPKSLTLNAGDKAVVDKVCGSIRTCVVLVVSGRPMVLTEEAAKADALVASWLPGTEGAGVADVLFGKVPFTGRLSMTLPRSEAQVPINVGDRSYSPLYPYGWGLRTDSAKQRLQDARETLRKGKKDAGVRDGARYLDTALQQSRWNVNGSVRDTARVTGLLLQAVTSLENSSRDVHDVQEAAVSVLRDLAMQAVVAGTAAPNAHHLIATADVALATGDQGAAARLLVRAIR